MTVVLVVEDEPLIRMDLTSMIEDAGIDVIEACNADDAIAILEVRKDITIIFTDIEMPGSMDGLKLAFAVRDAGHRYRSSSPAAASDRNRMRCRPRSNSFENPMTRRRC